MLWITLQLGVRNLMLHKLRSFLTMLGTILGVGSVIAMLAIGEGSKRKAVEQIRELGATNVIIRSIKPEPENEGESSNSSASQQQNSRVLEYGLKYRDFERLRETIPTVVRALPICLLRKDAQHGGRRMANSRILGTTPDCLKVKNLAVRRGRFLTDTDLRVTANVCVLGAGAAQRLFGYEDPLSKDVLLGPSAYRVVGVLDQQTSGSERPGALNQANFNNDVYIPLTAARRRFGELQLIVRAGSVEFERTQLSEITLTVSSEKLVSQTAAMARSLLEKTHTRDNDYEVQVPLELLRQAEQEKRIWNLVLGSIAGIALLVGGIGIMNIMLATVTERTREIGIRRALGARRRDITSQFLVETTVLSSTGGVLGILVGILIPLIVTATSEIETVLSWWSIVLAFGISVATGIMFGMYPARRAAMMDPIEALRHE
jgi:putative ABC transport system permease protein